MQERGFPPPPRGVDRAGPSVDTSLQPWRGTAAADLQPRGPDALGMTQSSDRAAPRGSRAPGAGTRPADHLAPATILAVLAVVLVLALALVVAVSVVLSLLPVPVVALGPPVG